MNQMISLLNDIDKNPNLYESIYKYNGVEVPRVTKILGKCIHNDSLMYWANSLGFKRQSYSKTLAMSAAIGTECHASIDSFLENNNSEKSFINESARYAYESFLKWWNDIHYAGNTVNVLYHEYPLICPYFGGTMDGLYDINGKKYLVDYKTSNHITFNYCLQLAAYRYILRTELNIEIDGCIILQLSKNDISYNEYVLNFDNINHLNFINDCERAFLSLVYAYYNILKIENDYKSIWRD